MAVDLEGGCRVTHYREGDPIREGTLSVWRQVGRATGARAISLRTLEFAPGRSSQIRNSDCDDVLFVLEGEATVTVGDSQYPVGADSGIYVRPGELFAVENPGPGPFV